MIDHGVSRNIEISLNFHTLLTEHSKSAKMIPTEHAIKSTHRKGEMFYGNDNQKRKFI